MSVANVTSASLCAPVAGLPVAVTTGVGRVEAA